MSLVILSASIFLQFTAAGLALRLILVTGHKRAWSLIAAAMALMAVRRCITFYRISTGDLSLPPDMSQSIPGAQTIPLKLPEPEIAMTSDLPGTA